MSFILNKKFLKFKFKLSQKKKTQIKIIKTNTTTNQTKTKTAIKTKETKEKGIEIEIEKETEKEIEIETEIEKEIEKGIITFPTKAGKIQIITLINQGIITIPKGIKTIWKLKEERKAEDFIKAEAEVEVEAEEAQDRRNPGIPVTLTIIKIEGITKGIEIGKETDLKVMRAKAPQGKEEGRFLPRVRLVIPPVDILVPVDLRVNMILVILVKNFSWGFLFLLDDI